MPIWHRWGDPTNKDIDFKVYWKPSNLIISWFWVTYTISNVKYCFTRSRSLDLVLGQSITIPSAWEGGGSKNKPCSNSPSRPLSDTLHGCPVWFQSGTDWLQNLTNRVSSIQYKLWLKISYMRMRWLNSDVKYLLAVPRGQRRQISPKCNNSGTSWV